MIHLFSYEGGGTGPNKTYGSLSLFNTATGGLLSSFRKPPSSAYWGLYNILNLLMPPGKAASIHKGDYDRKGMVQSYGVKTGSDFRTALLNFGLDSQTVAIHGVAGYPLAEIYSWSKREFNWNGTTDKAFASPNCGPSSARVNAANLDSLRLPPLSMTVIRFHAPGETPAGLRSLHFGSGKRMLEPGDTLLAFGTYANPGGIITGLAWSKDTGKTWAPVPSLDGALDGPMENIVLNLPAGALPEGRNRILLWSRTIGAEVTDTLTVNVLGKLVPALLIDNFEDGDLVTSLKNGNKWGFFAQGKNNTKIVPSVAASPSPHMLGVFDIIQPADLGYDNYVQMSVALAAADVNANILGLEFTYAASHDKPGGRFELAVPSADVKDYDNFMVNLDNTGGEWKTVRFRWDELRQGGWGAPVGPLTPLKVRGIEFRALGEGKGFFRLDNLSFLAREGTSIERKPISDGSASWVLSHIRRLSANSVEIVTNGEYLEKAALYDMLGKEIPFQRTAGTKGKTVLTWHNNAKSGVHFLALRINGKQRLVKLHSIAQTH